MLAVAAAATFDAKIAAPDVSTVPELKLIFPLAFIFLKPPSHVALLLKFLFTIVAPSIFNVPFVATVYLSAVVPCV